MATPQIDTRNASALKAEMAELKQPLQYHEVDDSLSEWELARLTSKTWSMEQE